ncbi:MAG TPA: hypothetical protein VKZ93_06090 [Arenibacter sp.]|nr:hypothetical protein [Arenibacter sp.]
MRSNINRIRLPLRCILPGCPFRPGSPAGGGPPSPEGEGFLFRVPNMIDSRISTPSLPGKVAFAL